ncbi:hypothetical protein T4B_1209, partial [Trichinella pseudospiralis]
MDYVNSRSALRLVPATLSRPLSAHSKCGITEFKRYANAIENMKCLVMQLRDNGNWSGGVPQPFQ